MVESLLVNESSTRGSCYVEIVSDVVADVVGPIVCCLAICASFGGLGVLPDAEKRQTSWNFRGFNFLLGRNNEITTFCALPSVDFAVLVLCLVCLVPLNGAGAGTILPW